MRTKRLGDMLLELGLITEGQLKEALDYQAKEKERLGTTLVKHHYITEGQLIVAHGIHDRQTCQFVPGGA
mgnify:CR=1 FL=1